MPARYPRLKKCPRSYCRFLSGSNAALRRHIVAHGEDPERTVCGTYTFGRYYYRKKHESKCGRCKPAASAAPPVAPPVESDADSDPRGGGAGQAAREHKVVLDSPNYGVVNMTIQVFFPSPSYNSGSN